MDFDSHISIIASESNQNKIYMPEKIMVVYIAVYMCIYRYIYISQPYIFGAIMSCNIIAGLISYAEKPKLSIISNTKG
jgi:hypothetical protein